MSEEVEKKPQPRKTQKFARPGAVIPAETGDVLPPEDEHDHSPFEEAEKRLEDAGEKLEESSST